jgi:hypothetical protein
VWPCPGHLSKDKQRKEIEINICKLEIYELGKWTKFWLGSRTRVKGCEFPERKYPEV